ncbi:Protein disulfide-isomerase, partial [Fragariocoptes setiger]
MLSVSTLPLLFGALSAIIQFQNSVLSLSDDTEEVYKRDEDIIVLTGQNFQQALDEFDNVMVEFYAPWCGHCKAFAPDYVMIASILKNKGANVEFAKVDGSEERELLEKQDIAGFPTLKLFRKGKAPEVYHDYRNVTLLVEWIEHKIGPAAVTLTDAEQAETFKDSADVVVVAYIKDVSDNATQTFLGIADQYGDYKFALIHDQAVAGKLGLEKESVVLFKKFDEGRVKYDGELVDVESLKEFIRTNSLPLVVTFDQGNAQKIFGGEIKAHNLLFINKTDPSYTSIIEEFRKSAKNFKAKVLFVIIHSDQEDHERIIEYFGLKKEDLPGLRFIKLYEEMTKYKYDHEELEADKVTDFVNGVLEGKIKPHLLTQELPEDWDKQPVKTLVGTNFDDVAFDKTKDVLVEFYAPWCAHCKALAPTYAQLGEKYKDHETIVIAKIDAAANELEHTKINSYPTIKLYKKDTNEAVEYNGERTLDGLTRFLETGGDYGRAHPEDTFDEVDEQQPDAISDKHDEL